MSDIHSISIAEELRTSFRDYSMSVIIGRALPDVRDGLKPVHRRILYAMYSEGLLSSRKFSKCAGVVGEVLKKYHPHGDMPVYEALVRMAQPWNMRELLIDGQGNFGSVDGDPAAAYRYTEARLAKIAEELLRDIEKNTVDFIPNFDGTVEEPVVLPSRIPNLLVNGSEGIAVAMATRCPPHNLGEIITALLAVIAEKYEEGPEIDNRALFQMVPGPDFPTGGFICGTEGCRSALETGRGSVVLRGKAAVEYNERAKRQQIIIDEIPYQVNKARLLERIAELVRDKRVDGITDIRDESDRDGMRIAIDLRRDAMGDVILNQLYQLTPLQTSYPVNQLAIVQGQPRTLGLRDVLEEFISFRREVVTRRSRYELQEAQKRFHIVASLLVALDAIDRVIEIIRSSKNTEEAKTRLCEERFMGSEQLALFASAPTDQIDSWIKQGFAQLDETQAAAILEMRLSRLVGLEREKLVSEGQELLNTIARLLEILGDLKVMMGVIKGELIEIQAQFATPRRSQIIGGVGQMTDEDLIPEEDMLVTISHQGYIKRAPLANYRSQRRGGKGKTAVTAKEEDFIEDAFSASTHAYLLAFTNLGRVFWVKVHELPMAGPQSKGRPIVNLIQLSENEKVRTILPVRHFPAEEGKAFVVTATKWGKIKKTDLMAYSSPRSSGLIACGIEDNDELVGVKITEGKNDIILSTKAGMAIRFGESDVRPMGRQAAGVRGVSLRTGDELVSMEVLGDKSSILTVTEFGYGKRTDVAEYRCQTRGGIGLITIKCDERNGRVCGTIQVSEQDNVMLTTDAGILIRMKAGDVSEIGRNTKGVRLISVDRNSTERVIAVTRIDDNEDSEELNEGGE
ncbi:MAG: DNA gyrase subunit A [Myxococcaceae bacterium]|nr:DNA gyrase subunit A [Myxococcaceae bacterium]MBH2005772.1 DNA gyrase subunit A [Myxococcaceae bacterium]